MPVGALFKQRLSIGRCVREVTDVKSSRDFEVPGVGYVSKSLLLRS